MAYFAANLKQTYNQPNKVNIKYRSDKKAERTPNP
jgi:hypothetical protein